MTGHNDVADISKVHVLSADVLKVLRQDIHDTIFPSWMQRPPRNFGSPGHGKLKADNWRVVCTVSMVITLVRLWSDLAPTSTSTQRSFLENFVHLVIAVDYATRRSMGRDYLQTFDYHIQRYLVMLWDVFEHPLVPNHHLALHIKECLECFGPVHAWWGFPFERFNGMIAKINSNSRTGEF